MLPRLTFVLGGAASGKSQWAENLLLSSGLAPVYLATSRIFDDEINFKVAQHKSRRGGDWSTIEADIDLAGPLQAIQPDQAVLIDCATMWLNNVMMDAADIDAAQTALGDGLDACRGPVVIVSNEVGHGIVPENALARKFREVQGRLNCALATRAELAVLVTAGLPQVLKGRLP